MLSCRPLQRRLLAHALPHAVPLGSAGARRGTVGVPRSALSRQEKAQLMAGVHPQHSIAVARALDQAASSLRSLSVAHSDFLPPPGQEELLRVLGKLPQLAATLSGGYHEAERCRVSFGPPEVMEAEGAPASEVEDASELPSSLKGGPWSPAGRVGVLGAVAVCKVEGAFRGGAGPSGRVSHGDFLGAVLGAGIAREKVGDIILMEGEEGESGAGSPGACLRGAYVVVVPELQDYLVSSLTNVHRVDVATTAVAASEIQSKPQKVTQLRTVEASLRLDAVGSAGFRISRSKFGDLISSGKVRVNWREDVKGGHQLSEGDVISVRGMGRCRVGEIESTKKGRFAVDIIRYS